MLSEMGINKIFLVTAAAHMPRSVMLKEYVGMVIYGMSGWI